MKINKKDKKTIKEFLQESDNDAKRSKLEFSYKKIIIPILIILLGYAFHKNFAEISHLVTNFTSYLNMTDEQLDGQRIPIIIPDQEQKTEKATGQKLKREDAIKNYKYKKLTNVYDFKIKNQIDKIQVLMDKLTNPNDILQTIGKLARKYPDSCRLTYLEAVGLERLAEEKRSNQLLGRAIEKYGDVLNGKDVCPEELYVIAGVQKAKKQSFLGKGRQAMTTLNQMMEVYPGDIRIYNTAGVIGLTHGFNAEAKKSFQQALNLNSSDGLASVHLGFISKAIENDYDNSLGYFERGLLSNDEGVNDGRFYFHYGDALFRTNRTRQARAVYREGARRKLYPSEYQRSLYNYDGLAARPWWTHQQTGSSQMLKTLESKWRLIRDEALSLMDKEKGAFQIETEDLNEFKNNTWLQYDLYARGHIVKENCKRVPETCDLLRKFDRATSCKRGQIKFSLMHPGVHVWPHCGPTNCRIRAHLGLVVPELGPRIRVGDQGLAGSTKTWKEGEFIIFDDSFEHEVWHDGTSYRLVLIVDMWHPDLSAEAKRTMTSI